MKYKLLGFFTPIVTLIIGVLITMLIGILVSQTSSDGWAGLGAILMGIFFTGVAIIIELIVGVVLYIKKKTDYPLWMMIGVGSTFALTSLLGIILQFFN